MNRRRCCLAVAFVTLVVAGCGPDEPIPTPSPTAFVEPTPTVTRYDLHASVWYGGLVLTFGAATSELDPHGGRVSVETSIENPGPDDLTLAAPIRIVAGTQAFEPTRDSVLPTITAGGTADTTLEFDVVGLPSVDAAEVRVGDPDEHQGIVPFVAGAVIPVSLEPVDVPVSGRADAGDLRLTLRSGLLRWDLPDWAEELPSSSAVLTLTYDVTFLGSFSGGFAFTGDNVALKVPGGTILEPRADGRSQSVALLRRGRTTRDQFSRFEIPAGLPGTYKLLVLDGKEKAKIRFTLPG